MPDPTSAAGATPEGGATPPAGESAESNGSATTADDGLGDAGRRALSEVRKELKAAQKERDDLAAKVREREDAEKSEIEKATSRADAAESRIKALEHEQLQVRVATEAGIAHLWRRLLGSNEAELKADADELKKSLPEGSAGPGPDLGAGPRPTAPATGSAAFSDRLRKQARR
jgi:hypothetical protein